MSALDIDLVFPRFKLLSGAERLILALAGALLEKGHRPRIVCHQFDASCRARLASGVELACTGKRLDWSSNRYVNAVFDYLRAFRLGSALNHAADVQMFFGPALPLAWRQRRLARTAAAVVYFCYEPPRALHQDFELILGRVGARRYALAPVMRLYRLLDRRMVAAVDAVCTNSAFTADRIREYYDRPAAVITHGVDRERFDAARRASQPGPPTLLTVNYLHPRKRVELIIEAVVLLGRGVGPAERPAPRLLIVGDGPERAELEEQTRRLGVDEQVEFVGFVPDGELPGYYWGSTCYVHAAREESFGLSVIEASYCERPVVAVDEGGVKETVEHGVTGYRVGATATDIAAAVAKVLASPDRGAGLGEAGRQRVTASYSWRRGAEDLLSLVGDLVSR